MQKKLVAAVLGLVVVGGGAWWWSRREPPAPQPEGRPPKVAATPDPRPSMIPKTLPHEEGAKEVPTAPPPPAALTVSSHPSTTEPLGDVELHDATDADRERLKVPRKYGHGVILKNVGPDSPMALSALRDDDVIVRAHRTEVNSTSDLEQAFKGRDHTVVIVSRGGELFEAVIHRPSEH